MLTEDILSLVLLTKMLFKLYILRQRRAYYGNIKNPFLFQAIADHLIIWHHINYASYHYYVFSFLVYLLINVFFSELYFSDSCIL